MAREEDPEPADLAREREREWQEIVENFGERAVLEPPEDAADAADAVPRPVPADPVDPVDPDETFVPPAPPPVPRPPLDRLLAWGGVFGIPAVVLFCIVAGIGVPTWLALVMAAGFVGGFGYLVLRMSDEPRDPWDDGAVL